MQVRPVIDVGFARALRAFAHALGVVAVASAFAGSAHAAGAKPAKAPTIEFSPVILEVEATAGERVLRTFDVTATGTALDLEFVHADFGFSGDDYSLRMIPDDAEETTSFSTRGWFSLASPQLRIPAGARRRVRLRIDVPKNTPGGTYLGAALLRSAPEEDAPGQVKTAVQGGPLVFVSVEGGDPPKPRIREFDAPRFATGGPIEPTLVVANEGDEFFSVDGTVTLRGPGRDAKALIGRQYVVPDEPRELRTSASDKERTGRLRLGKDLGFGRYVLETRLRVEPTGTTLVSRRTVWVIPTWMRILGLVAVLALAAGITLLVRWVLRRRVARILAAFPEGEDEGEESNDDADDVDDDLDSDTGSDDDIGSDDEDSSTLD